MPPLPRSRPTPPAPPHPRAVRRLTVPPRGMPSVGLVTWNVGGLGGLKGLSKLMTYIQKNKKNKKMAVVQEHNLSATEVKTAKRNAISAGRKDDPASTRGGAFILVDTTQVGLEDEDILYEDPGFVRVRLTWGADKLDVANLYAPVQPLGRIDFYNTLRQKLSSDTVVGGDWNTVSDTTLDIVRSSNPLGYQNRGAALLATIMGEHGLTDERREQLGNEREYTRTADDGSISHSTRERR
eukprot:2001045-Prymnesium_polylepis.1